MGGGGEGRGRTWAAQGSVIAGVQEKRIHSLPQQKQQQKAAVGQTDPRGDQERPQVQVDGKGIEREGGGRVEMIIY